MKRMLASALTLILLAAALSGCGAAQEREPISISMTIAETLPSCVAFEADCFYAYDAEGWLYRVLWTDFEGLHEKDRVLVEYTERKEFTYPEYGSGWSPKYEITATRVELESAALTPCLTQESDSYTLTLPQSGETIRLSEEQERFVPYITDALVEAAERKILQDVAAYDYHSFFLRVTEGYLCLVSEVIKPLDDPGEFEEDHEHLFYSERISTQAVKAEEDPEKFAESAVIYCSDESKTHALSTLLWAKCDNGDGTYTETQGMGIKDVLPAEDELAELHLPELFSSQYGTVQPLVPVNGEVLGVYLLDMTDRANYPITETTWEEIEMLPAGRYYIVTQVLLSGNCDPDALQHSFCYEDLFCLVVEEPTHSG